MQGLRQQGGRVELLQLVQGAQVLLAVGQPATPQLADAGVVAQGGEHVVQGLALRAVHLHIAAGDHGQAQFAGQAVQDQVALHLVVAQQVGDTQPYPARAQAGELPTPGAAGLVVILRQPDQQAAL